MNIINKLLENINLGKTVYVDRQAINNFVDGKPTDEVTAYKYVVVLPNWSFEKITVRIEGSAQLDAPNVSYDVAFENLRAIPYVNSTTNRVQLAFRADKIKPVNNNK